MKFEVNIEKKYAFVIIGLLVLVAGLIVGYAYGGNAPQIMGHSAGELDITLTNGSVVSLQSAVSGNMLSAAQQQPLCPLNSVLTYNSSGWSCVKSVYQGYAMMDAGHWCDPNDGNDNLNQHIFPGPSTGSPCSQSAYNTEVSTTPFLYNYTRIRKIVVNVSYVPDNTWPAVGTIYTFDGGTNTNPNLCSANVLCNITGLPFNQAVTVFNSNSRSIQFSVNTFTLSGATYPSFMFVNLQTNEWGADRLQFNIGYERYCVAYDGNCIS
jgi:hypothetical protein